MPKRFFIKASVIVGFAILPQQAWADDWGCQVLLCASGKNPSWQQEPTCHPPMTKLIAAMKLPGFSWPTCPTSNSTKAKFERYEDCPAGWRVASNSQGSDRSEGNICQKPLTQKEAKDYRKGRGDLPTVGGTKPGTGAVQQIELKSKSIGNGNREEYYLEQPRKRRADPYYIDYDYSDGTRHRAWFNLNL